jgi:nucleoside-diphosphate-sugar epimerase
MTKRILVLGGDGFIGAWVVAALAGSGWAAPVVGSRRKGLDAIDPEALKAALRGVDGVVNCAAGPPAAMIAVAQNLFTSGVDIPLVHLSSMAVYGSATGLIGEEAPLLADLGAYAEAKLAAEKLSSAHPRVVILRPGCVYGPGSVQWSGRIARLLQARRIGDLGAGGDGCSNLVHAADVAAAAVAALRNPAAAGQAYNLAMAGAPSWNDYFLAFARALGAVPIVRLSERRLKIEGKLLAPPLKIAEILAAKVGRATLVPPPIPSSLVRLWRQEIRLSAEKAERDLGLTWRDLDEGLAETAAWINSAA